MPPPPEPHLSVLEPSLDYKEEVTMVEEVAENGGAFAPSELAHLDKKLLLKLDLSVIPVVSVIYLLAYLDRANIGNARVVSYSDRYSILPSLILLRLVLTLTPV